LSFNKPRRPYLFSIRIDHLNKWDDYTLGAIKYEYILDNQVSDESDPDSEFKLC